MGQEKKEKIKIKIGSLLSFLKYPEMKNKETFFWTKCNKALTIRGHNMEHMIYC
jgi:hypothetical protein